METNPEIYIGPMTEETANSYNVTRLHLKEQLKLKKVVAVQDDSGHWYVIPAEMHEDFSKLLAISCNYDDLSQEQAEIEFNDMFSVYRTNGDLNNVQLYSEV